MDDSLPFQIDPALLAGVAADQGYRLPATASTAGAPSSGSDGDPSLPHAPVKSPRWKLPVLLAACLLVGTVGGALGQFLVAKPKADKPAEPTAPAAVKHEAPPATDHREQIEEWLRAGQYADVLKLLPETPAVHDRPAWYLRGLALEGAKRYAEARAAYQHATDADGDPVHWAVAVLGQVRCALALNDAASSRHLLAKVELRAGTAGFAAVHIPAECALLRGRSALLRLGAFPEPDPLSADAVAWPTFLTQSEIYLDWLAIKPTPAEPHGSAADATPHGSAADATPHASAKYVAPHLEVRASATTPEREVTANLPTTPLPALIKELATAAGLTLQISPDQDAKLRGRSSHLAVDRSALPVVLAALLEPLDFGWETTDKTMKLVPLAGAPKPVLQARARQAFAEAVELAPEHPFARRALLAVANFDFLDRKYLPAAQGYRRLQDANRIGDETVAAAYNSGLAQLKLKDAIASREAFLDVVDRSGGSGRWFDLGWFWMGRADLDAGDIRAAFRPLRSALTGKSKDVRSAAAIGLLTCHLLQGDSAEALDTFRKQTIAPLASHAPYAVLFDELFRYRTTPSDLRAANVHEAIAACGEGQALGPAGTVLVGELYREIGKGRKMTALYDREMERAKGAWPLRMTFATAVQLESVGELARARPRYLAVAAIDPSGIGLKAELRLAALAAQSGRGAECVARCKGLVGKPGLSDAELLPVFGRGYELLKNPLAAAACFAGRFPSE